jgi:type IV secretion system protein VirB10
MNNNTYTESSGSTANVQHDDQNTKFNSGIPPLGVDTSRSINKKGLFFVGLVGLIGLSAVFWMVSKSGSNKEEAKLKAAKEEVVNIPERKNLVVATKAMPLPAPVPAVSPVAAISTPAALPIPLATDLKGKEASKDAKVITLGQRRGLDAMLVLPDNSKSNIITAVDESAELIKRRSNQSGSITYANAGYTPATAYSPPSSASNNAAAVDTSKQSPIEKYMASMAGLLGGAAGGGGLGNAGTTAAVPITSSGSHQSNTNAMAFPVQAARSIPLSADLSILQGSSIRCLMNTRLVSDIPGQVVCTVVDNILSTSAKKILIPKGSKVVGDYSGKASESLERVGIIWNRLITPDNIDIALMSPGTDPLGSAGVPGYVDEKWRLRLGAAVLITLASDIIKVGAQIYGPRTTIATTDATTGRVTYSEIPFDSATVKMIEKAPQPFLNRVLNAPPTVIINQGTLVSIQTAKDMDFSDVYENK